MLKDNKMNRKGEVSETMTWVFATIIIIMMIFLFLFAVNLLGQQKNLNFGAKMEDSGVSTEEMLFGILSKEVSGKKIQDLIVNGDNSLANSEIDKILSDFDYYGIKCDFSAKGISVKKGGSGKDVSIIVGGKEVSLRC